MSNTEFTHLSSRGSAHKTELWPVKSLSTENGIMKLKVRGVQTKTSIKDGLGCILKSFGCTGDVEFATLPMYYDYEIFPVRFV